MKADIHPNMNPVIFVDTSTGTEFVTTSTLTSEEKKKVNGVDHYVIKVEISSASHPFYTGKRKLVDTAGRVDKFLERAKKAQEMKAKQVKTVDKELDEILHKEDEVESPKKKSAKPKKEAAKKEKKSDEPANDNATPEEDQKEAA